MHTLFALEDIYGLKIENIDGKICIYTDPDRVADNDDLSKSLSAWEEQAAKLYAGEITKEDYDRWRYIYSKYDTTRIWAHVPSNELSDYLIKQFKKDGLL